MKKLTFLVTILASFILSAATLTFAEEAFLVENSEYTEQESLLVSEYALLEGEVLTEEEFMQSAAIVIGSLISFIIGDGQEKGKIVKKKRPPTIPEAKKALDEAVKKYQDKCKKDPTLPGCQEIVEEMAKSATVLNALLVRKKKIEEAKEKAKKKREEMIKKMKARMRG
ncbi:hypothetical protein OAO01_06425 [Oligoflexia bacterium]|nr:hypothetical protein [Oligoflexia bacterium]